MHEPTPHQETHNPDRALKRALLTLLLGGIWTFLLFNSTLFPVLDDGISGTVADQAQAIEDDFTQWRVAWLVSMPARLLIGIGLFLLGRELARRETGHRSSAATLAGWVGLINVPLGIARVLITFGDAEFAADPGLWFGILWGAHWLGTIIAGLVIAWLTYGLIAQRWAVVVLVAFTLLTTVLVAGPPAYTGMGVYAAAVLWRMRKGWPHDRPARKHQKVTATS